MAKVLKKTELKRSSSEFDRTVVYRGIKIPPIRGKPSATALAIRDAFRMKFDRRRRKSARD